MKIALIGYGEVGRLFARDLAPVAAPILAYDIAFEGSACAPPATAARDAAEAVAGADLVISAVTAGSALAAARSAAPHMRAGALFLDVNSVSPATKQAAAAFVDAAGGRYVEAAVMASVPPDGIRAPMLLGGPHARTAAAVLGPLGFNATVYSDEVGPASAVKMCRSVVIKGLEALLTESLATARRHGVEADVLASLAETFPGQDWKKVGGYMISRALRHGRRRAEEMREVARTVEEAGFSPDLALAVAARQDWAHRNGQGVKQTDLSAILDALMLRLARDEP